MELKYVFLKKTIKKIKIKFDINTKQNKMLRDKLKKKQIKDSNQIRSNQKNESHN
jgi:hypothetical protein